MQPKILLCDANITIRLLTNDSEKLTPIVIKLFTDAQKGIHKLYFTTPCIAEIIWVLQSHYNQKPQRISETLKTLLTQKGVILHEPLVILQALEDYKTQNVDFIDAYHARLALNTAFEMTSFDRDFKKWPELNCKPLQ